ncbi:sodium:solute symporter family protein [Dasania sp. GY-MA-18]|uniref:Sodium:solute symporter family protein n=1 Tax=Dasania phycosphaerae TaxID=2950436 RepID=A0A9J6RMV0_9GAMM|nr:MULTISPECIES: sodium:solute symporter family protein [Dasania]MCR8922886.1 sodium:solute symporter family protein [Dasania sp. GY-MA-18]MCZ0865317.1 sodium:solute symporter family protein [Dasania phycosphaerae]MCZ0869042.1 sodium:solute symporter family protein [Dasania phycosphaerae]
MLTEMFKYGLVGSYVVLIYWLSWIGMRRTKDIGGFSIGNKDMSPYLIGITLAASIASTATFVINPGFIYSHGLSAYLHYGVAGSLGILSAFLLLSRGFLRLGEEKQALTIPDWIYHRYQHRGFSLFFAFINLLSITFVVLILVGCSLLMTGIFPIEQKTALVIVLVFVFSYVLMGGTYAHAYTNTLQGIMMILVTVVLFVQGLHYFDGGFFSSLKTISLSYAMPFNKDSNLYYSFFSVFGSGFIITFALMLQPHILTKVLYLRNEADIGKFIGTTVVVGTLFSLILMIGFYAKLSGLEIASQDTVVREYLLHEFSGSAIDELTLTFIFITLLATGMSTLDGILVSLSAMVVNDIVTPLKGNKHQGLAWSRWVLVIVGVIGLTLAWNPPPLIGLFAQKGVYGLAAASVVPILFGVLIRGHLPLAVIATAAVIGLLLHFYLNLFGGVLNPAVSASYAIVISVIFAVIGLWIKRQKAPHLLRE